MLKGKKLSILGDSLSTYRGYSNDQTANATTIGNPCFYFQRRFPLEKTYWQLLMARLGLTLCVNNSWSGGNLSGQDNPDSGVNRAKQLSRDDGTKPDFIIVFMGMNDLGRNVPVPTFSVDYMKTLFTIQEQHPDAIVCCVGMPDREPYFKERAILFNQEIEKAVAAAGKNFFFANLFHSRLNNQDYYNNTLDGLHFDEDGMRMLADFLEEAILNFYQNR